MVVLLVYYDERDVDGWWHSIGKSFVLVAYISGETQISMLVIMSGL